jgi:hypothetical protein
VIGMTWKIKKEMCPTCIFRPGNLMFLNPGRVKSMVEECEAKDSYIVCHETLADWDNGRKEDEAMCAGYLRNHSPQLLRIGERLGIIEEV